MAHKHEHSLQLSVGILGFSGGSLLLLINNYASNSNYTFISHTALGILLLITAALLAYAAVSYCLSHAQVFSALCLTISALWCGMGLVYILMGRRVLTPAEFNASLIPGLAAFSLALFLISFIAIIVKKSVLFLIAIGISLACAHQIADLSVSSFGHNATAANYLLVFLTSVYFGIGRLLSIITHGKGELPGTSLKDKVGQKAEQDHSSDIILAGLVMNLLSAAVIASPLFGVGLNAGHVCWLWTAAVYQFGICILLYRAMNSLAATFYAFMALLKFAEGYSIILFGHPPVSPVPLLVVFSVLFSILALFSCSKSLLEGLYQLFFAAYCIAFAAQAYGVFEKGVQGVQAAIFIVTAGMLFINSYSIVTTTRTFTGQVYFKALVDRIKGFTLRVDKDQHAPHLGYSKYADADVLGHACNMLAAFAMTGADGVPDPRSLMVLPWVVVGGGLLQLLCGSVAFSRGKTFESTVFFLYGVLWTFWGFIRYGNFYDEVRGFNIAVGIISFLLFNSLVTVAALFLSVAWFLYILTFQLIIISFLLDAVGALPYGYDIGVTIIFGLISFYCFLAKMFSRTFQTHYIPLGKPLITLSGVLGVCSNTCPHVPARKATSVQQIEEIMKNGGICGVPTDTVYVLAAACNRPDAVVKAYNVKTQAEDRPMSVWISSIKQLEPVRHQLSPLLLDFMEAAWPSCISMVIPRGPWIDVLGLGDAAKHIGTPQSIAIRNPDCAVATHLMNLVGPIAVTSANPTGEADTTHHNQVFAKLGDKVDGVLCDGPSPENIASTVVDCTKIESGQIGFFRVGLIPKSKVLQIFEEVQKRHKQGQENSAFEYDGHLRNLSPPL